MWCDNCLLLFPLRAGAMAWAFIVLLYSFAGGLFLLLRGQFLFFHYPEWQIYGGIGCGVALMALITIFALGNRSYIWTRVVKFLWPFVIVICGIRAILMVVELQRGKDNIQWECDNGGLPWSSSPQAQAANNSTVTATSTSTIPSSFCSTGFSSLNAAFIISLLVDIAFQIYMFFLVWRYSKRLENYDGLKGPFAGGYYS
jgi:hypothetical protein